jgi:hypothetical protein
MLLIKQNIANFIMIKWWFRKDVSQNTNLQEPTRQQRYDTIKRERPKGYFQLAKVHTAISYKYFWP